LGQSESDTWIWKHSAAEPMKNHSLVHLRLVTTYFSFWIWKRTVSFPAAQCFRFHSMNSIKSCVLKERKKERKKGDK
jgi:hypothetical protein